MRKKNWTYRSFSSTGATAVERRSCKRIMEGKGLIFLEGGVKLMIYSHNLYILVLLIRTMEFLISNTPRVAACMTCMPVTGPKFGASSLLTNLGRPYP